MAQLTINYKPADKTYDVIVAAAGTAGVMRPARRRVKVRA